MAYHWEKAVLEGLVRRGLRKRRESTTKHTNGLKQRGAGAGKLRRYARSELL